MESVINETHMLQSQPPNQSFDEHRSNPSSRILATMNAVTLSSSIVSSAAFWQTECHRSTRFASHDFLDFLHHITAASGS
jgi:hypothetical protein